jgi:hypothetical protein
MWRTNALTENVQDEADRPNHWKPKTDIEVKLKEKLKMDFGFRIYVQNITGKKRVFIPQSE